MAIHLGHSVDISHQGALAGRMIVFGSTGMFYGCIVVGESEKEVSLEIRNLWHNSRLLQLLYAMKMGRWSAIWRKPNHLLLTY